MSRNHTEVFENASSNFKRNHNFAEFVNQVSDETNQRLSFLLKNFS